MIGKGRKHSEKTKEKISLARKGMRFSKEHKLKISLVHKGIKPSNATKLKMSLAKRNMAEATKQKMSLAHINNANYLGHKHSRKSKLKMSLSSFKYNPNYEYCDIWKDKEYKKDIRKDYCENVNCKNKSKRLDNHHIYLDKKRCAPHEIMTLCDSCHAILHRRLEMGKRIPVNSKDYIIINKSGHISYIHKELREIIKIKRRKKKCQEKTKRGRPKDLPAQEMAEEKAKEIIQEQRKGLEPEKEGQKDLVQNRKMRAINK